VDHFARWSLLRCEGQNLNQWMTDGLHANAFGHRQIAQTIFPVLMELL